MSKADPMPLAFDELRSIEQAFVYKSGNLAGTLTRASDSVLFEYSRSYQSSGGPPVATTLPLSSEPVRTHSAGAVPPFFAGLLPEGRRLTALRRAVKTSADDDFTLLLAVGGDTVGDVQVSGTGEKPEDIESGAGDLPWSEVRFADLFAASIGAGVERVAIPGVQEKVSARMINLPVAYQSGYFILKLNPPEFPHLVENERFFLDAASKSGLPVAEAAVVTDAEGESGLLVRRFDREIDDAGQTIMFAQEDGCQALGLYPADKYRVTTEEVFMRLSGICRAKPVAARDLLRQVAFAYLSCNGDAHGKNFSVVRRPESEWRVTPAYDIPSSHPYGDYTMAISINGLTNEDIGRSDFVALGAAIGLGTRAVDKTLDHLVARSDLWIDDLSALPFDERKLHKLKKSILYRRSRIAR